MCGKSFKVIVAALFCINILNFLDRGIIPGASEEFNSFITSSGITNQQSVFLGLLQSSFIIGYAIASVIFGHVVHFYAPFYICIAGLSVWIIAVTFSGLSYYSGSYAFLFLARMVSGVGEAAFQITIPPWISKHSPPSQRGLYLSLFFTAIPTGTAIGYAYAAAVATSIGWQYAYFLEAILMSLFLPFLFYIAPMYPLKSEEREVDDPLVASRELVSDVPIDEHFVESSAKPSMADELRALLNSPIFVCVVAGYAAQTATVIGLSTFGSSFLIGLGYFASETESSSVFGALVCVAGVLSTPLGGYAVDRYNAWNRAIREAESSTGHLSKKFLELIELRAALSVIVVVNFIGATLLIVTVCMTDKYIFLLTLFCGTFSLFLSSAGINLVAMLSVPEQHRALAIGMSCLGLHLFGDMPSPILTGWLKDYFAPACSGGESSSASSSACQDEHGGLRLTLFCVTAWLYMCVLFMSIAWGLGLRKWRRTWGDERSQWLLQVNGDGYNGTHDYGRKSIYDLRRQQVRADKINEYHECSSTDGDLSVEGDTNS